MTKRSAPKRMRRALRVTACLMLTVSTSRAATRLAVTADRVNLRAAPQSEAEVVGQVSRTDTLILQGSLTDPWVQVQPPDTIDLWVYAPLVKDNTIDVSAAQVRAGAGLNFNVVGRLERGDTIVRRGQISDWIKIAPFPGSSVWITNTYVALIHPETPPPAPAEPPAVRPVPPPPAPAPRPEPTPAPAPRPAVVPRTPPVTPTPPATPAAPRRTLLGSTDDQPVGPARVPAHRLRQAIGQATAGSYSGTLTFVPHGNHPTRFRLVTFTADNKPETVCYVLGNHQQLDTLKNGFFTVEGAVYWFVGTELPTVFAQNILRH